MTEINKLLHYLQDWKTSQQIKKEFELSNTEFFNLINWCKKAHLVESYSCGGIEKGKTNRSFLYKAITS